MTKTKTITVIFSLCITMSIALSDVPPAVVHKPSIPYLYESMQFRTIQMNIFPAAVSGMVTDSYSDLQLNPANILRTSQRSVYVDFNAHGDPSSIVQIPSIPVIYYDSNNYYDFSTDVLPRWYSQTSVGAVSTIPHYNIALLFPISSKMTIGFINRSLFDYGPFRSSSWWANGGGRAWDQSDSYIKEDLKPERLEIDENQQTVIGTQSEIIAGFRVSKKIDIGVRVGHYIFNREGNLFDSKWATYPHSSFADLNDELLNADGNHIETGIGLTYHLDDKTRLSAYGGLMNGTGSEAIATIDTSDSWSEQDTDKTYYNIYEYSLESSDYYDSEGEKPEMTLSFEKEFSSNLIFRSFIRGTWSDIDFSGSRVSEDTTFGDRTYDQWVWGSTELRRRKYYTGRNSRLDGTGSETSNLWTLSSSLIYAPNKTWSLFGGFQLQRYSFKQKVNEVSAYTSNSYTEYSLYKPETNRDYYTHDKIYSIQTNYDQWSVLLPIGIKVEIIKGLHVILGTDILLTITDQHSRGQLTYPEKITRKWENGMLIVDDEEINRYEEYSSDPAKEFNRSIGHRFGIVYEHPLGIKMYIRPVGDIFNTTNWAFGFEMNW
jgi:hypothetical protein